MNPLDRPFGRFPLGVWIALIALASLMLGWAMQAYSLADWDGAVEIGIQEDRISSEDPVEEALAEVSEGVALADMLWPLPLTLVALWGVWRRRLVGFAAGLMTLSVGVYFPLFFGFRSWDTHQDVVIAAAILWAIPSLLGIIGLWANRTVFGITITGEAGSYA